MPGNGWDLTLLIKPKLDLQSKNALLKQLQGLLGEVDVKPEKISKSLKKGIEDGAKKAKVDISVKEVDRAVTSAMRSMAAMLGQVNKALQTVESTMQKARPTAGVPTAAGRPVQPTQSRPEPRVTSTRGAVPQKVASPSGPADVTSAHKRITENLKQAYEKQANAMSVAATKLADTTGIASKKATDAVISKIKGDVTRSISGFGKEFIRISDAISKLKDKAGIDIGAIRKAPDVRALAARSTQHAGRRVTSESVERSLGGGAFVEGKSESFTNLKEKIKALNSVSNKAVDLPARRIAELVSSIKGLTSAKSASRVPVGPAEVKKLDSATERLMKDTFHNIINGMTSEISSIEGKLMSAIRAKKVNPAAIQRLSKSYGDSLRQLIQVYETIEKSGKFNINIDQLLGKRQGKGPRQRAPESEFLATPIKSISKRISGFPAAQEALKVASSFDKIPDVIDRTKKVFDVLFAKMDTSSNDFKKDMFAVAGAIRLISQSDPVKSKELEITAKSVEKYADQIVKMQAALKGIAGAGGAAITIPNMDQMLGPGATQRQALQAVDRAKKILAKTGKRGVDVPLNINFTDAGGNMQKMSLLMRKMGTTAEQVRIKVNDQFRQMGSKQVMGQAFRRVAVWGAAAGIIYGGVAALREAMRVMLEAETGVVSLSKVMREADIDLESFRKNAQDFATKTAVKYGSSIKDIFEAMRIFGQQGLNMAQTQKLVEATAVAANVSVLNQAQAAEALTAATRQFGIEASQAMNIVDAWNEIANKNAVTVATLADATKKAGAAAKTVGIEYEQFLGLVTAIGTATRQPGKEIGTSLRFIFQRTLRPESEKALNKFGIATRDLAGDFKGFIPLLSTMATSWDNLSKSQKLTLAQALGGARQYNVFLALMNNFDIAVKATNDAIDSNGSAMDENQKIMGTASKKFEQMRASLHGLYISFGNSLLPALKDTADITRDLIDWFGGLDKTTKQAAATIGIMAIAVGRLSVQLDYMMTGTAIGGVAEGGLLGGAAGLVGGRGLAPEAVAAMPIAKLAGMSPTTRLSKEFSDFGKSSKGISKSLAGVGGSIRDISGRAVPAAENFSKMGLAIRSFGAQTAGAVTPAIVGFQALNSPLSKVLLLLVRMGKWPFQKLANIGAAAVVLAGNIGLVNKALAANAALSIRASIASAGWVASLGAVAVTAVALSYVLGKVWDKYFKSSKKVDAGPAAEKRFQSLIALEEKRLKQVKQRLSWMSRLDKQNTKFSRSDLQFSQKKDKLSEKEIQKSQDSIVLGKLRLAQATKQTGSFLLKISPATIKSVDKYGNAILNFDASLGQLSKTAVAAQAHMVALARINIAEAYGKDASGFLKDVKKELKGLDRLTPGIRGMSAVFGDLGASSESYQKVVQ